MRDSFVRALLEEAKKNPDLVLITGDLGFGVLEEFQRNLPNQFINSGVNEQTMMGMAAGIASTGKRVFVYSIANFPTLRCIEQIRNDVCYMNNSVVIVSVGAGYAYGSQGYTHHALEDVAIMRALPNMEVIAPADAIETTLLTRELADTKYPAYFRLGKSKEPILHNNSPKFEFGKFVKMVEGSQGAILFNGSIGKIAIDAVATLRDQNKLVSLYSVPFISSIDIEELRAISRMGKVVVVEEHSGRGGLASAILECAARFKIDIELSFIASDQLNLSQIGDQDFLRIANGITIENIVNNFK